MRCGERFDGCSKEKNKSGTGRTGPGRFGVENRIRLVVVDTTGVLSI
jgi:hypothetical protein